MPPRDELAPPAVGAQAAPPRPLSRNAGEGRGEGAAAVRTACPYCGVGCGVLAKPEGPQAARVAGDPAHPASAGRLCSKGSALAETLGLEGRLLHPEIDGRRVSWDAALDRVARGFAETIATHGPDSVAFYVSGQLLTEDYYAANKLMKGFIGSANIDTNSRLCMASSVAGHRRAFGTDTVPGAYEDLELADLVVLTGSNLAWCHPILHQRLAAAKAARPGTRVILIDPRRTATADIADDHLALAPGADVALFGGLLRWLAEAGALDAAYVAAHVSGLDAALAAVAPLTPAAVARATGLAVAQVEAFYRAWTATPRTVTLWSQGVNQSDRGTDKVNAIINCHLATGRIGRAGAGPFSVTGQPNAMGGREVGGLATMLAAHLEIENPEHRARVQRFWGSPAIADRPGLKAVDMFRAVADGRVKAIWVMATNPAVSLPEADAVRDALRACPFVVVSDMMADADTARLGHVRLPAAGWGEKDGAVTNAERVISRQRAFLPPPGEARPDWRIVAGVAARMGWADAFAWDGPAAVFREHAALSGVAGRDFDISAWADCADADYDAMAPFAWPAPKAGPAGGRFFAQGGFFTDDRRARAVPTPYVEARAPRTAAHPFTLNTGRVRDHWHTMTRTGRAPKLSAHMAEPFVEAHPDDAARLGLAPADLARVTGAGGGQAVLRVLVTDRVRPGDLFAPMHWTAETASAGRVGAVIAARTDAASGQPALKGAAVALARWPAAWHALAICRDRPVTAGADYWALARRRGGWSVELAGLTAPADWTAFAARLLGAGNRAPLVCADPAAGAFRAAYLDAGGRLVGAIFAGPRPVAVSRAFVAAALDGGGDPAALLAGRPGAETPDPGPTLCACFEVGVNDIARAVAAQGLSDVASVTAALQAGGNCGSCRPEIARLVAQVRQRSDA